MNIDRLREFLVLASCLNYSKAAVKLYITQPILSRHIYELEKKIGAKLFIRDTHRVKLTGVGMACVREFSAVVEHYDSAMKVISKAAKIENKQVTVSFLGNAVEPFFLDFLKNFHKNNPGITLDFFNDDLEQVINLLNVDQVDIAFATHVNPAILANLEHIELMRDSLFALLPEGSELAEKETVTIQDLANFPMIQIDEEHNSNAYYFNTRLFKNAQTPLNAVKEVANVETGVFYVDLGIGGFILPGHLLNSYSGRKTVRVTGEDCHVDVIATWKKDNDNPSLAVFIEALKKFFKQKAAPD